MDPSAEDLALMTVAAREAGEAVMRYFRLGERVGEEAGVRQKGADNPITEADLAANRILHHRLQGARPGYGWLSEETADTRLRLERERVFVVDPIDGTKEFITGLPQFAVSVALVIRGEVAAGVVFNPATDELFSAVRGGGTRLNGEPIRATSRRELAGATCLASRSETGRGDWKPFEEEFVITPMGSIALKLALVAAGRFDLTFTLTPKSEWDIAAGLLLVTEAGGVTSDREGRPFRLNQPAVKVLSVLAANAFLHAPLLARLQGCPLAPGREG